MPIYIIAKVLSVATQQCFVPVSAFLLSVECSGWQIIMILLIDKGYTICYLSVVRFGSS